MVIEISFIKNGKRKNSELSSIDFGILLCCIAATAAVEGKMGKTLKKVLKKLFVDDCKEILAVADAKLGNCIKVRMQE